MASEQVSASIVCSVEELAADLSERFPRLGVAQSDLIIPTSAFVTKVFLAYLNETFQAVLPQQFCNEEMAAKYPDVYQHILPVSKLHYSISIILKANSCYEFYFSDITNPAPKRTLTILALLENTARFWDMKMSNLQPLFDKVSRRRELHRSLVAQKEKLRQQLNDRATNKAQRGIQTQELSKQVELKKRNIDRLCEELTVAQDEANQVQSELYNVTQHCESLAESCRNIDKQNTDLSKQVVVNPDDLTNELAAIKEQLNLKVAEVKAMNEKLQLRKVNTNQYQQIAESQQHRTKLLKEIISSSACLQKKKTEMDSLENQCKSMTEDMKRDQDNVALQQDVVKHLQDKIIGLKMQKDARESQLKKSLNVAKEEQSRVEKKLDDSHRSCAEIEKLLLESKNNIETMKDNMLNIASYTKKRYEEIVTQEANLDSEISQVVDNLTDQVKRHLHKLQED